MRKPSLAKGLCPNRALQGRSPSGFWLPRKRSPQKAALEDLSVCYPRLRQVAFGMYMPRSTRTCKSKCRQGADTMSSTTTNDSKKPLTKQELITANIKLLIEQLEAGQSDALTNYLTAMSR